MGIYSDEPDPPTYFQVVETADCVRYTDLGQAQWFMDRINYAFGGQASTNVRLAEDGTTIRWFGYYQLRLGDWLYKGNTAIDDKTLRASALKPSLTQWSAEDSVPGAAGGTA